MEPLGLQIGWLNAWLLMLFFPLQPVILQLVDKAVGKGDIYKKLAGDAPDPAQMRISRIATLLLYALVVFSIFIPLKTGTPWIWVGLLIYLLGVVIFLSAVQAAARTPLGELFSTGMYRYSRHPLYVSVSIILLGVGISSASWLFLLFAAMYVALTFATVASEEQACLAVFGDRYRTYMAVTPRWIGIPRKW